MILTTGQWFDIVNTNLNGLYLVTKAVLRHMPNQAGGRVINISSVLGKFGVPGYTAYCTTKHGVIGFTRALALEVVSRGITVNTVCPGWVDTEMAALGIKETAALQGITPAEFKAQAIEAVPIKDFSKQTKSPSSFATLLQTQPPVLPGKRSTFAAVKP